MNDLSRNELIDLGNMKTFENWLLLTATITPIAKANQTLRADPTERLADYKDALRFYLNKHGDAIDGVLFLENSDADLSELEAVAREENPAAIPVKFFSALSDCDPSFGKGHAELQLMDRAFQSEIGNGPQTRRFWKITGRLKITNIDRLIKKAPEQADLYIDLRLTPNWLRVFGTDRWADTRLIRFTPKGYRENFFGIKDIVGTTGGLSHVVELAIFPVLYERWQTGESIVPRFNVQPIMEGIGAESLKNYNDLPSKLKSAIRSFSRRVIPSLWL